MLAGDLHIVNVGGDGRDNVAQRGFRQVVAQFVDLEIGGTRNNGGGFTPRLDRDQGVGVAVDYKRGNLEALQVCASIAVGENGGELP